MQKISDAELRDALLEYQIREAERLQKIAAESPHRFSLRFHLRMQELFRKSADIKEGPSPVQRAIPIRKIGIVLIAVLLAVLSLCATAIAVRNAYRLVEKVFPKYSDVHYENPVPQEHGEFVLYEITDLPEGFVQDEESSFYMPNKGKAFTAYYRGDEYVILKQHYADTVSDRLNTENIMLKPITNADIAGYSYSNEGVTYILWTEKQFAFLLCGNVDKDTLIDAADDVKLQ